MNSIHHGGRLDEAIARYGGDRQDWLDLSTGINPQGYPVAELAPELFQRLPESGALARLKVAARDFYAIDKAQAVVAGSGSQAMIEALPHVLSKIMGKDRLRVGVFSPAYGEHEYCWRKCGHEVHRLGGEYAVEHHDVIVVINPNNPTGHLFERDMLVEMARKLERHGGMLVVDEAFCDLYPACSMASFAGPNVVVLKSIGKFFGLAGIRLGFAISSPEISNRLQRHLGPWNVSALAIEIGCRALTDHEWTAETREYLAQMAAQQGQVLTAAGLTLEGDRKLFQLVSHPQSGQIYQALLKRHILVRKFEDHPDWLRFGLAGDGESLNRLKNAIHESLSGVVSLA